MEIQTLGTPELFYSHPQYTHSSYDPENTFLNSEDRDEVLLSGVEFDIPAAESGIIQSIYTDDKSALVAHSKRLFERFPEPWDRSITLKLLHICCTIDSADCAAVLLDGELGAAPMVNEIGEAGKSPLHMAAEHHAARCTELLLRKRARTDLRTRDGRAQFALDVSLSSSRMDVDWSPDDDSIEDLIVRIGEKDLTTIRLISERTKEVAEIALAKAVEGHIVALAALLFVAAERIDDTTVYKGVVLAALSLGRKTTSSSPETTNDTERRKFLLSELQLLQLFGVVDLCSYKDKNVKSPGLLIRAVQAGDETVVALLLKTNIDIDEADAEGNSAIHHSVKSSRALSLPEIKILMLLLKHGARASQKNKLGLTAIHLAAGNGHFQALQILLLEDPDGTKCRTEVKETPLFFAVKNDHMDCVELLLHWGAKSEVFNLRKQRPMDLAKSQDMRFMLSPTNIGLMKRSVQKKHAISSQDEVFIDNWEKLLSVINDETTSERSGSSAGSDICKFLSSPHGCVKGAKCFYAHSEEELRTTKQRTHRSYSPSAMELKRRIFVGGLPQSVNSALLGKYFEKNFGPVQDAIVLETQIGNHTQSRGFGFVTFKTEKPVSAAVQAHFVTIMDKKVEIKSMIAKRVLENESQKMSDQQNNLEMTEKHQPQSLTTTCSSAASEDETMPTWLRVFNKWLPSFLENMLKHSRESEYALSSLKGDFRAKFSLELDHVSLGYPKLSDFMKCYSDLCSIKVVPIGRGESPNHMILTPKSTIDDGDDKSYYSNSTLEDRDGNEKQLPPTWFSPFATPDVMQLLQRDPLFHIFHGPQNTYDTTKGNLQHKVLEAFSSSRKSTSFFLREFDFYINYYASVKEGKCFGCNEREVLWANFPCQHVLWCVNCKVKASLAAGSSVHRCVVCDVEVQKIDLLTCQDYRHLVDQYIFREEFPPLHSSQIRSPSIRKDFA